MIPARIAFSLLRLWFLSGAMAQTGEFEGRTITEVRFSPLQPLDQADLAKAVPFKKGDVLHASDVAKSIDGLFATGRFQDIAVEVEESGDGVIVRFATQLTFFLGHTEIEGTENAREPGAGPRGRAVYDRHSVS
jgi:outer membrane protein assembly factor BamA